MDSALSSGPASILTGQGLASISAQQSTGRSWAGGVSGLNKKRRASGQGCCGLAAPLQADQAVALPFPRLCTLCTGPHVSRSTLHTSYWRTHPELTLKSQIPRRSPFFKFWTSL